MSNVGDDYLYNVASLGGDDDHVVKSARRVMQIFEFFSEHNKPTTEIEISRRLGIPQSSTSMLLKSLVTLGYLEFSHDDRTFRPSIRISLLGGWAEERLVVAEHILALMKDLHLATQETVVLGVQCAHFIRYIHVIQSEARQRMYLQTSTLRPLCNTAPGQMLLTLKSDGEIRALVRRVNAEETNPDNWVRIAPFLEVIAKCRSAGFSCTESQRIGPGGSMVAALLPVQDGSRPLSIGIMGALPHFRHSREACLKSLMEAVRPLYDHFTAQAVDDSDHVPAEIEPLKRRGSDAIRHEELV